MQLHSRVVLIASSSLMCFTTLLAQAGTVIDDFQSGSITVTRGGDHPGEAMQTGLDSSSVVGGERSITVGEFGGAGQTLSIDATSGKLNFLTNESHGYFMVEYGSEVMPLNLDLLANGANALVLDFTKSSTSTSQPLRLLIFTTGDAGTFQSRLFAEVPQTLPNGLTRLRFPFEFISPEADFQRVERIELSASRVRPLSSFTIHRIATVPEPSALFLVIVGVCIFVSRAQQRPNLRHASNSHVAVPWEHML